ncbi:MAG: GNAT family N-acetyltransferase [Kiritimatiellaceae bacterium]|nr:GNAT family N-acetyltransferase [Kiritimatiellaceae bacterium]
MKARLQPDESASPSGSLRIVEVDTFPELGKHADAWAELLLQSTTASPMLSYPWISAFFEHRLIPGERWLCLFAYEGDRLVGVLPLITVRSYKLPLRPVLLFKMPHDLLHTASVDCLTLRGRENLLGTFIKHLQVSRKGWPLIRFRSLPDSSPSMICFKQKECSAVCRPAGAENFIRLPVDYNAYHEGLSHGFRRQLKRRGRKLEELPDVRFLLRETSRTVAENLAHFMEVESSGWKGERNSAIQDDRENAALFLAAAERLERHGWMEWNFLEADGKTIAAHFAMRINRTLYVIKIGYRDDYSFCTPGNLLFAKVIENSIAQGDVDEINCMAVCDWHKEWNVQGRSLYDLVVFPRIPVFSALICSAARMLKAHK